MTKGDSPVKRGLYGVWLPPDDLLAKIATEEDTTVGELRKMALGGEITILASKVSQGIPGFRACAIGNRLRKKVCAVTGADASDERCLSEQELAAVLTSGPDVMCDLSIGDSIEQNVRFLRVNASIPVGSAPTYDIFRPSVRKKLTKDAVLRRIRSHMELGVDFVLLHTGVNEEILEQFTSSRRSIPVTSRGGGLVVRYMQTTREENPLITHFDDICELCLEYQVVLDLGDIFRPGCLGDGETVCESGGIKECELRLHKQLRYRALKLGVQVLCEAGGHVPLHRIPEFVRWTKAQLDQAAVWFNGPLPLDRAVGKDSLASAIGIALAACHGGDLFLATTDAEHFARPTPLQTAEAVRNTKIALAIAEYSAGSASEVSKNHAMGQARQQRNWREQAKLAVFPDLARNLFMTHNLLERSTPCTLCGPYCPLLVGQQELSGPTTNPPQLTESVGDGGASDVRLNWSAGPRRNA